VDNECGCWSVKRFDDASILALGAPLDHDDGCSGRHDRAGALIVRCMTKRLRSAGPILWFSAVVLTLSACGTSHNAADGKAAKGSTSTTRTSSSSTTSPAAPTTTTTTSHVAASIRCQPSDLRLAVGQQVSEKTEQHSALLTVTNVGSVACYLFGYPGISLYDVQGVLLPLSYESQGDQMVTSSPPQQVNLAVGAAGYVLINKMVCGGPEVAVAATLGFIPPDDTASLALENPPGGLTSCEPRDIGNTLDISPVEPTEGAVFAQSTLP